MEKKVQGELGWVNLLRIIACFLVVVSHSCDPFVAQFDSNRGAFLTGVFTGSFVRSCVPLFVMMSGVLLLPINMSMADFYKKRIVRILIPLVFWSLALPLLFYVYLTYINPGTQNPALNLANHTLDATLGNLYLFVFNFSFATIPLWYMYMLVGLYLIMPVFSGWLKQATKKDIEIFLCVWGIALVLPYIKMLAPVLGYKGNYGNMGLFGVCDWNDYGTFYYISGFTGYLVMAYYLVKYPLDWSWNKMLSICIPMFLVGYLVTSFGFIETQKHFPGNYANLEIVWYFAGINVFMMTFPVFVIVQKMNVASTPGLSKLASLTFGIYLCHFVFVELGYDVMEAIAAPLPVFFKILGIACITFGISALLVLLMKAFKPTRRFIM
ncbi:acyltransferase [Pedobacter gandavensis]|uniref:acyltransferase n=1 Tax=Pedobacter gandavensis TaxID=2679963 RepID=UPI00292F7015|nr:acyltransferase family protein [Pedobacter gandavensis]